MKFFVLFALALVAPEAYGGSNDVAPCGTFIPYDPSFEPRLPERNGFSGGIYLDGSQAYVGYGDSGNCNVQPFIPGRISTNNTYRGPGIYMSCGGKYVYDKHSPKYLQASPLLEWSEVRAWHAPDVPGLIVLDSGKYKFAFGRTTVRLANGTRYTEVSKVHISPESTGIWYMTPTGEKSAIGNFQVLTCV